jgi:hypothetical protein
LLGKQEMTMRQRFGAFGKLALGLAGAAAALLAAGEANAASLSVPELGAQPSQVTQVKIYRRGRSPIYPYYYNPGRPGGYSFYFGFVPYAKGDYGTQALNRSLYPQDIEWPPSMYRYGPRAGWGPKRSD